MEEVVVWRRWRCGGGEGGEAHLGGEPPLGVPHPEVAPELPVEEQELGGAPGQGLLLCWESLGKDFKKTTRFLSTFCG